MKRFLLFRGQTYYAAGGWNDFKGSFDTLEEAKATPKVEYCDDWEHVIDTVSGNIVHQDGHAQT